MIATPAYAAFDATSPLRPLTVERREPRPTDVAIDILYCGVCHSDLHQVRNQWAHTSYPLVPGHEIVGRVARVGAAVTRFAVGDAVGVGCFVDSCRRCAACARGEEQYCHGVTFTYNGVQDGAPTFGGYSTGIVVDERYVLRIPPSLPLHAAAPLLCAGITTWSPLRHWKVGPGTRVGVVGLGGLGHMAVKLAAALGAEVTLFSSSPSKAADGKRLGAQEVVLAGDDAAIARHAERLDLVIDTASVKHDLGRFLGTLRTDGTMVLLGAPERPAELSAFSLISRRRSLGGSLIGGIAETQEALDFCGDKGLAADVEVIPMQAIDTAYDRMERGDVRYRFVIDLATLRA